MESIAEQVGTDPALTIVIYMADCLIGSEAGRLDLSTIDPHVLTRHKIASHLELSKGFTDLTESLNLRIFGNKIKEEPIPRCIEGYLRSSFL